MQNSHGAVWFKTFALIQNRDGAHECVRAEVHLDRGIHFRILVIQSPPPVPHTLNLG